MDKGVKVAYVECLYPEPIGFDAIERILILDSLSGNRYTLIEGKISYDKVRNEIKKMSDKSD